MKQTIILLSAFFYLSNLISQDKMEELPFRTIPEYTSTYNEHTVAARMIDGLGFRYYWATEELREIDLQVKASDTGRTIDQTLDHIYNLCKTTRNAIKQLPNKDDALGSEEMSLADKRRATLQLINEASVLLKEQKIPIADMKIIFQRGEKRSEFPFWNVLNGPLADALWHVGQVVMLRRAGGNPIPGGISVFSGTVREP